MNEIKLQLPRAILFDYDGVLVASEPIHLLAWMQLLKDLGLPEDETLIRSRVGRTAPEILSSLLDRYEPGWSQQKYDLNELARKKAEYYLACAHLGLKLYEGVPDLLKWLKCQQIQIAIVSNGRRNEIIKTMTHLGIFEYIDEVVSREDVSAFKPDPTHYLFAAAALGREPQECVAIEDSPTGLESALLAKIPAVAVLSNFTQEQVATPVPGRPDLRPTLIVPHIKAFHDWLRSLR